MSELVISENTTYKEAGKPPQFDLPASAPQVFVAVPPHCSPASALVISAQLFAGN